MLKIEILFARHTAQDGRPFKDWALAEATTQATRSAAVYFIVIIGKWYLARLKVVGIKDGVFKEGMVTKGELNNKLEEGRSFCTNGLWTA